MASPAPRRVFIKTFGCQMNVYDSGKMLALLAHDGFESTEDWRSADLVIVNTCSVREKPQLKVHSFLGPILRRRAAKGRPMVAVAGCVAQHDGAKLFRRIPALDLVFGPDGVPRVRELVRAAAERRVLDTQFLEVVDYPFVQDLVPPREREVTALVTIQKGCDNHCTYCIVPSTRGAQVSRPAPGILDEIRALTARGVRDITLIGQNANAYGLDGDEHPSFAQLLHRVSEVPDLDRLRFTTSHPRDMGPDVIACWAELPKLASHLHLPVQAGSDRVLRRMGRQYSRAHFLDVVQGLRQARPDISLTTDFIVGFPGERREDFEQTLSLLEEVRFDAAFTFKYSARPGTAALRLKEPELDPDVSSAWLSELQRLQSRIQHEKNEAYVGRVLEVLVERPSRNDPQQWMGRSSCFRAVNFPGDASMVGNLVPVRVTKAHPHSLQGEPA
jgi:tRNA-2-methylthio-N6-dimethylallyladenosine synthase